MAAHGHRRQVLLFLVAIILPCVVLVLLGLRIMAQDRELRAKRLADERHALVGQVRQELAARLDAAALRDAPTLLSPPPGTGLRPPEDAIVAVVAKVVNGQVVLPWDEDPRALDFRRSATQARFAERVSRGEHLEFAEHAPQAAAAIYSEALAAARDRRQATYARLLRGRASIAAGRRDVAQRDYDAVLETGADLLDEHGVPLTLYAAARLLEAGVRHASVTTALQHVLDDPRWLSPTAVYLMRDLSLLLTDGDSSAGTPARALQDRVGARVALSERTLALQRDYPRLGVGPQGGSASGAGTRWVTYGAPPWLIGQASPPGMDDTLVVAVWADPILRSAERSLSSAGATVLLTASDTSDGELLGAGFPGLVARFPEAAAAGGGWDPRRWFYVVTLLLVISTTLFGGYFLSRDVRRELRLAELRSRFVSAVSHELKTPLTAIRMYAETLQLARSPDPERQRDYLETIVNESERLTRLLNNVLDFSKIERGRMEYRPRPDDLAGIVRASARAMRYPLEQQQFTLNLEVPEEFPAANVDRDAIEQAILNLLANAMKYSGNGQVIDLRLTRANGDAVIEVVDRGVGIAATEQERIFEQFYRVPTGDTDGVPGTGLGLTLVRHIAEGHGGRVSVCSAPGHGSTFAIHLPLEIRDT